MFALQAEDRFHNETHIPKTDTQPKALIYTKLCKEISA
jgi:hypothetical protein